MNIRSIPSDWYTWYCTQLSPMTVYATMKHQGTECFRYKIAKSQLCVSIRLRLLISGVAMHGGDAQMQINGVRGWRSYYLLLYGERCPYQWIRHSTSCFTTFVLYLRNTYCTVHQLTCLMVIQRISIYSVKIQPAFLIVMKVNTRIGYALRVSQILYNTQCLTHHGELGKATPDK